MLCNTGLDGKMCHILWGLQGGTHFSVEIYLNMWSSMHPWFFLLPNGIYNFTAVVCVFRLHEGIIRGKDIFLLLEMTWNSSSFSYPSVSYYCSFREITVYHACETMHPTYSFLFYPLKLELMRNTLFLHVCALIWCTC